MTRMLSKYVIWDKDEQAADNNMYYIRHRLRAPNMTHTYCLAHHRHHTQPHDNT
jgi:hypothetical protein